MKNPIKRIVPHRTLALNRGEKEDILRVSIIPNEDKILQYIKKSIH